MSNPDNIPDGNSLLPERQSSPLADIPEEAEKPLDNGPVAENLQSDAVAQELGEAQKTPGKRGRSATRRAAPRKKIVRKGKNLPAGNVARPEQPTQPEETENDSAQKSPANSVAESDVAPNEDKSGAETAEQPEKKPRSRGRFVRHGKRQRQARETGNVSQPDAVQEQQEAAFISVEQIFLQIIRFPALPPGKNRNEREVKKKKPALNLPVAVQQTVKRMFISVLPGEQVEVAIAEDGRVLEYYLDMLHQQKIKGNIYKGVIHNIDSSLQAAFINYGAEKNGFLQIDEVHPEYWQTPFESAADRKFPPIQKALRTGQELLVQVVKEPAGSKGAFLTTWLSLAGRFLVLTPGQEQIGVSRKVTDHEERNRLREMMNGIDPGNGLGVIVRTVGEGATKTTLKNDLQYLKRLWRDIRKKGTETSAPALIHQEPGLSERAVRDYLTEDVREIWVDNELEAENVRAMSTLLFPRKKDLVRLYSDASQTMWEHFNLNRQLDQIYAREVSLPSGGRLVFDQTEALMAIDINSGKISGKGNFEAMAFRTNMEASEAIARQLRLRDIGGQIVIDFIEMRDKKHVLEVEKALRQAMKSDRARHEVARMSSFGLLELVRQRMGSSALSICMETCTACGGTGLRRNLEWQALQAIRDIRHKMHGFSGSHYVYEAPRELGLYLLNYKRETLQGLESDFGKRLEIKIQV